MDGFIERFTFKVIQIHLFSNIHISLFLLQTCVVFLAGDEINI
jgi:hypothetical protein